MKGENGCLTYTRQICPYLKPDRKDAFICPLCLTSFTRDALSAKLLSEEHIIPSGNLTTLTCKKCNNETGFAIDAHLLKLVQHEEEMSSSGGTIRAKIMIGRGEHNANIYLTEKDGKPFIVVKRRRFF